MTDEQRKTVLTEAAKNSSHSSIFIGYDLNSFIKNHTVWSRNTFGPDGNPMGSLKHLKKEVDEVLENPTDIIEYADCFILLCDAVRRAGFSFLQLLYTAIEKQKINEQRQWPKPVAGEPCEHIRDGD